MANPYHHAVSSVRKWGGVPEDYIEVHSWFDQSKEHLADFRHRALRHHTQGIFECERVFGPTIDLSVCKRCGIARDVHVTPWRGSSKPVTCNDFEPKRIPTRWIGEQHVQEDLGRIPSVSDWLLQIQPEPWMNRSKRLSVEREREA